MSDLAKKVCVACEGGVQPFTRDEAMRYVSEVPAWTLDETGKHLERRWIFKDFAESMRFVSRVAAIAEEQNHHPDIAISYNKVVLTLTTHAIKGLSENDFIMAAKIDGITSDM